MTGGEARRCKGHGLASRLAQIGQSGRHGLTDGGVLLDDSSLVELGAAVDGCQYFVGLGSRASGKVSQSLLAAVQGASRGREGLYRNNLPGDGYDV